MGFQRILREAKEHGSRLVPVSAGFLPSCMRKQQFGKIEIFKETDLEHEKNNYLLRRNGRNQFDDREDRLLPSNMERPAPTDRDRAMWVMHREFNEAVVREHGAAWLSSFAGMSKKRTCGRSYVRAVRRLSQRSGPWRGNMRRLMNLCSSGWLATKGSRLRCLECRRWISTK
ncbi:hypothetical protein ACFS07_36575 [Undibacterium arcticum]